MKVLLINHFPLTGSGSGVYTNNLAKSLKKLGHEVCIIFPENEPVKSTDDIKLHPVYFNNDVVPFNFPCFTTHPRSIQTFYSLTSEERDTYKNLFAQAIEEEIANFEPDIIHAGHIWTLADIAGSYDIPLIITAHGTDLIGYNKSLEYREDAYNAFDKAEKIITISKDNKVLVDEIYGEGKSMLIANGYDPNVFYKENVNKNEFLKQFEIPNNYKHIVSFAGKFTEEKGIDTLIKAAKLYENDDIVTILAGNGEMFEKMNNLAESLEVKNLYFIKNQPHDVLRKLYSLADVSIVPSRQEAFGLVVIEAMACGTPVIGSNTGGIPDIINNSIGVLNDVDDYKNLANEITLILNGTKQFDENHIANYALNKYSQDQFTKIVVEIYKEAIENKKIRSNKM